MAQDKKPAAPQAETGGASKKKTILVTVGVLLLLGVTAGGTWYFTKSNNNASHGEEVKVVPPKTPIFIVIDPVTVNLQREENDQYLQIGITLKAYESEIESKVKVSMPEIRSKILQLLTTKTATELLTAEGKKKLVKEIMTLGNGIIGIVNTPEPMSPVKAASAPQVGEAGSETQHAPTGEIASAPSTAHKTEAGKAAEPKGIIDVLFTSFIIQ